MKILNLEEKSLHEEKYYEVKNVLEIEVKK